MSGPAMYYLGLGFTALFGVLALVAYFYISSKTGRRLLFLPLFASAWFVSASSYVFLVAGVPAAVWYITLLRIITYVLFTAMLVVMIIELSKPRA